MALDYSRTQSIENNPNLNENRLSSLGSKASLNYSSIQINSPELLYKNIAEKISFRFPDL